MLIPENNASGNFVSPDLKEWVPAEYEAGYAARFADASESLTATHCWRVGWEDANAELSESAGQNRLIAEGQGRGVHGGVVHPLRHWRRRPFEWNPIR